MPGIGISGPPGYVEMVQQSQIEWAGALPDDFNLKPGETYDSVIQKLNRRLKEVEGELAALKQFVDREIHDIKKQMRWDDVTEGTNEPPPDSGQHPDVHPHISST